MDKLEPILKQKFWIILAIGLIMTIVGWFMATRGLAASIATRKTEIEAAEKGIPTGQTPNDDWSNKLSAINTRQEAMVTTVRRQMWDQQRAVMTWPETLREFVDELPYQGEFGLVARDLYRSSYLFAVEEVWRQAKPIELDGTGVVYFPMQSMPIKKTILGEIAPKSSEIWEAQEDLWLLVPLLQAIREVNGGPDATRLDASIQVINKIELMGGERTTGESSSGSGGGMEGMEGMMGAEAGMGMMTGSGGGRANETGGKPLPADFSPEEEFGSSGREGGARGGGGGMMMMAEGGAEGGMGGGEPVVTKRYVDDDESAPYKTRAFYLSVTMDHRKVPLLISQLTAGGTSPWPIEVVRVQMARLNPDDTEGRNLGGGMGGMMAGGDPAAMGTSSGFAGAGGAALPEAGAGASGLPEGYAGGDEAGGLGMMPQQGAVAPQVSVEVALQDPFMARVAIAGLIYLYRPVEAPEAAADPSAEPTPGAVAEGATEGAMPPDAAAPAADPAAVDPAAVPAAPASGAAPATFDPGAAPAEFDPGAAPPTPQPAAPATEGAPAAGETPAAPAATPGAPAEAGSPDQPAPPPDTPADPVPPAAPAP